MSKESKVLLATVLICTLLLAGLQLFLNTRVVRANLRIADALDKSVQGRTDALKGKLDKMSASPSASATVSASPAGKKVSPSPVGKVKPTASAEASATPEATSAQ